MKCNKCGFDNPEGAKFCSECGARLGNVCPNCGQPVLEGAKFCSQCGANLSSNVEEKPKIVDSTKPLYSKNTYEKILNKISCRRVGSILLILVSLFGFIYSANNSNRSISQGSAFFVICVFLIYAGIRGFNAESKKYGVMAVVVVVADFLGTIIERIVHYSNGLRYADYSVVTIVIYLAFLIPGILMCISPKTKLRAGGESLVYYCGNCDCFWLIDSYLQTAECPVCKGNAIKTDIQYRIFKNWSDQDYEHYREEYFRKWNEIVAQDKTGKDD